MSIRECLALEPSREACDVGPQGRYAQPDSGGAVSRGIQGCRRHHENEPWRSFDRRSMGRLRLWRSPALRIAAGWVGERWRTEASLPGPVFSTMAAITSEIISPVYHATRMAPTIVSVPFFEMNLHEFLVLSLRNRTVHVRIRAHEHRRSEGVRRHIALVRIGATFLIVALWRLKSPTRSIMQL
jgi:hypothetical protein